MDGALAFEVGVGVHNAMRGERRWVFRRAGSHNRSPFPAKGALKS